MPETLDDHLGQAARDYRARLAEEQKFQGVYSSFLDERVLPLLRTVGENQELASLKRNSGLRVHVDKRAASDKGPTLWIGNSALTYEPNPETFRVIRIVCIDGGEETRTAVLPSTTTQADEEAAITAFVREALGVGR